MGGDQEEKKKKNDDDEKLNNGTCCHYFQQCERPDKKLITTLPQAVTESIKLPHGDHISIATKTSIVTNV